jgi:hypothetical protein
MVILGGRREKVIVFVMYLVQFVKGSELVCQAMRPVEEKILHKEDKVSLPKDLPKGRECIEAKVYSDD